MQQDVKKNKDSTRKNKEIKVPEVRVIGSSGEQLGVMSPLSALLIAEEEGLDLVEISPQAMPPVCKIMDYGKHKYAQSKKAQEQKKKQHIVELKEIQLRPNTGAHDMQTKANHIRRFISGGHKVKLVLRFKGREVSHAELGYNAVNELVSLVKDVALPESAHPKMEGRRLTLILLPS